MKSCLQDRVDGIDRGSNARLLALDSHDEIWLEQWVPGSLVRRSITRELRLLVLDGAFRETETTFGPQSWLRLLEGETLLAEAGPEGCTVWIERHRHPALSKAA